jgi:hypothetical protein
MICLSVVLERKSLFQALYKNNLRNTRTRLATTLRGQAGDEVLKGITKNTPIDREKIQKLLAASNRLQK